MLQNKEKELVWSVFPARESIAKTIAVLATIIGFGVVVYLTTGDIFLSILSMIILTASLHGFFTVTWYRLSDEGVEIRRAIGHLRKQWTDFKRFYADKKGITLSPFEKPSRLEAFRSVRLLFGGNREDVVEFVSKNIGRGTPID